MNAALGDDWTNHFSNWAAAVTLSGLGVTNDAKLNYKPVYNDDLTGQKIGICTNCTRKNATGDSYTFAGFAPSEAINGEGNYEGLLMATGVDSVKITGFVNN